MGGGRRIRYKRAHASAQTPAISRDPEETTLLAGSILGRKAAPALGRRRSGRIKLQEVREATVLDDWIEVMAAGESHPPARAHRHPEAAAKVAPLVEIAALLQLQGRLAQSLVD
jgi:hypothetical protein